MAATLAALPPEVLTTVLVSVIAVAGTRVASLLGAEHPERFKLEADDRALLHESWLPAVRHYSAGATVHPLVLGLAGTAIVFGMKALPPGGLESILQGGEAPQTAPGAVSTAELVKPKPEPKGDPVLELVRQQAAELSSSKKASNA
jgi:hypothetical protein